MARSNEGESIDLYMIIKKHLKAYKRLIPLRITRGVWSYLQEKIVSLQLFYIAKSNRPIVVGPWISELGFELLYWKPFLKTFIEKNNICRERLHVVSRGGMRFLYEGIAANYYDIYEISSEFDFKAQMESRIKALGTQKHLKYSKWDSEILRKLGLSKFIVLHPNLMFRQFSGLWAGGSQVPSNSLSHSIANNDGSMGVGEFVFDGVTKIPDKYCLVRLYSSKCFQPSAKDISEINELIDAISRKMTIVVLSPNFNVDDHYVVDIKPPNAVTIKDLPVVNNIAIQNWLVKQAELFICTYGGMSYLGIFNGVSTIALHTNGRFLDQHLNEALKASKILNTTDAQCNADYLISMPTSKLLRGLAR